MKILHVNTNDIEGGAARAANRLHKGLLQKNIYSRMIVNNKKTDDFTVITLNTNKLERIKTKIRLFLDEKLKSIYFKRLKVTWSCNLFCNKSLVNFINKSNFDIVHFHWINASMLSIKDIKKINKPIVWTMHDMWPFTGGCHYSDNCVLYKEDCNKCKQLSNKKDTFLSGYILKEKYSSYKKKSIVYVTPSEWLEKCSKESFLLKNSNIKVIPNGIDLKIFKKLDKNFCKKILNLDLSKKYILFGAMTSTSDKRKGYDLLKRALSFFKEKFYLKDKDIVLLVFGANKPQNNENLPFDINYLGQISDDITLNIIYNSADVFIAPSREDNLPNTIVEALSCGVPCVAFNVGGMIDLIEHKNNGYLAEPFNIEDLAEGINFVLEDENRWNNLSENALNKAQKDYNINDISDKYIDLYKKILGCDDK
ncbi:MAG: glycosyltransferase family 4 protein [Megamonas funiformis]|uniref:glycosyltransferase family 4 protein n=1 Tax=Megamonas funiformis TaxID=437897 RepID=UPI0039908DBC